ncbi:hypothetical protein BS47DRAFT_1335807 [Hydnum rufescens UP504]|uniref:Carbonic anhydrase n=1 Tax=Hydnum rufescens UP504 TaxID=1448309 RepID=A0A9P6BAQ3_9AGAM|nr:hypothetical protein BS47DRAFT_1335807 [Hydnum rufescens UP504]
MWRLKFRSPTLVHLFPSPGSIIRISSFNYSKVMSTADEPTEVKETSFPLDTAAREILVLSCMDPRILPSPARVLGLPAGAAFTVRNAGGRAAEAIRSIVVAQQLLTVKEIRVLHHTDCGLTKFRDDDLRAKLIADPPKPDVPITAAVQSLSFLAFDDLKQSVLDDVAFLKEHPLVLAKSKVSGWIYDVYTGETTRVI